ncbi:MAG: lipase [Leptospiraceae bacterium]|nr:MAG: lipase [Leptospiraceae bacterium]
MIPYKYFLCFFLILYSLSAKELYLKKTKIQNYEIEYYYGGIKKPYFLLIHGLGVDKNSFYDFAKHIVNHYHLKVLLPDIPGQGKTKRIYERNYSIENIADFLYLFLKQMNISKVILVGNSMGGHIATVFSLKYPQNVKTLILINPAGIEWENQKPYQLIPEDSILNENNSKIIEDLKWNNKIRKDIQNNKYYILNPYLKKIINPTLLFWGKDDTILPYYYSSIWATEINNVHFFVLKGGHLLQKEKPKEIAKHIFSNPCIKIKN